MDKGKIVSFRHYAERRRRERELSHPTAGRGLAGWLDVYRRIWEQSLDRLSDYLRLVKREREMDDLTVTTPADEPLIIMTRTFNAPRILVWKVMTEAQHIPHWWGWSKAKTTVEKLDARPGGTWRFAQVMPDGRRIVFLGTYLEVEPHEKLVNTFGMEGMYEDKLIVESHRLEEIDGRTVLTSTSRLDSVADRDAFVATGMEGGARESYNRMDAYLGTLVATN